MSNDFPDWTAGAFLQLLSASGQLLGDTGGAVLDPDKGTETMGGGNDFRGDAGAVIASFKAAAGLLAALVGAPGAVTVGTDVAVTPPFGQATTAGNFLVVGVVGGNAEPATAAGGWVLVKSRYINGWAQIWIKPNCGAGEVAPTFTSTAGSYFMIAQAVEASGVATVAPTESTGQGQGFRAPVVATNAARDAAFGDLVVMVSDWPLFNTNVPTFTQTFNNGAVIVSSASGFTTHPPGPNAGSFTFAIIPPSRVALPLGVVPWDYDATGFAVGSQGAVVTVTLAGVVGKAYRLAMLSAAMIARTAAADFQSLQVLDGAAQIYGRLFAFQAVAGDKDSVDLSGMALRGTAGNSLVVKFAGAGAGTQESINVGAYLR